MSKEFGYLFPGQGSQVVGMGKALYEANPESKEIFEKASEILGYDLKEICFEGPIEKLTQTVYSQPAIFTTSIAVLKYLQFKFPEIKPAASIGLSLGEYTALVAAESISFEDGLKLVKLRAEAMEEAANQTEGTMASILGTPLELIKEVCDAIDGVSIANLNSPEQIVISGDIPAVQKAMEVLKEKKAKRIIPLNVSGAFHSHLMKHAEEKLKDAINKTNITEPKTLFIPNVTALPESDPTKIKQNLLLQLTGSVRWYQSFEELVSKGIQQYIEIGPGTVLKGLARKTNKETTVYSVESVDSFEALSSVFQNS